MIDTDAALAALSLDDKCRLLAGKTTWRTKAFPHAGIPDPIAALVLSTPPPLSLLLVNGTPVVQNNTLTTVDPAALATQVAPTQQALTHAQP